MKIRTLSIPVVLLLAVLLTGCGKKNERSRRKAESRIEKDTREAAHDLGDALDKAGDSLNRGLRSLQDSTSGRKK